MTDDETAAIETLEMLANGREKTAARIDPDAASPGAQFEARRLEEEADHLRMGAAAIRVKGMLVEALENIRQIEEYVKGRPCACGEPGCVQCIAIAALAEARKTP